MRQRTIVCPLIQNDGAYLLCKMADDRGVFPGQWRFRVAAWSLANELKRHYAAKFAKNWENSCF